MTLPSPYTIYPHLYLYNNSISSTTKTTTTTTGRRTTSSWAFVSCLPDIFYIFKTQMKNTVMTIQFISKPYKRPVSLNCAEIIHQTFWFYLKINLSKYLDVYSCLKEIGQYSQDNRQRMLATKPDFAWPHRQNCHNQLQLNKLRYPHLQNCFAQNKLLKGKQPDTSVLYRVNKSGIR